MAEDAGGRARLEELLDDWARAYDIMSSQDSDDLPEAVIEDMQALMELGGWIERDN